MAAKPDDAHPSVHPKSFQIRSMIKKDGRLNIRSSHERYSLFGDLYHHFFSMDWPQFVAHVVVIYLAINVVFGSLYFVLGIEPIGKIATTALERFRDCFFLSVETISAIDYDRIPPSGVLPYVLMTIQALLSIFTLAIITGLFFARFSRPTARVIFSNKAIIGHHNGKPCLFFRVANERLNQIAEARMTVSLTKNETSKEGDHSRKFYELKLERDYTPLFALSWTVRHYIDAQSPLHGMNQKSMSETQMGILASLTGVDDTFVQPIMARHIYTVEDLEYNKRFKDIIIWHERKVHIDLTAIHDVHELKLPD